MKKYVTIIDIARKLGISKSTVSRALSGSVQNVSKETLDRVLQEADRMGYTKNEMAVNLRNRSTRTIGIIIPEINTSFYMEFFSITQKLLQAQGYSGILMLSDENSEIERANFEILNRCRVDGILISVCHNKANLDLYKRCLKNTPIVFFDRTIADLDCSSVHYDDYLSAFFMVEHLVYGSRKKILYLSGPDYVRNTSDRLHAYKDVLKKHRIPYDPSLVLKAGLEKEDGMQAMKQVLADGLSFNAVFCFTEMLALGAKIALQEHRVRIPEDVAIACMSGTRLSTLVHPAITAVEQPVACIAEESVRLLLNKIERPDTPNEQVLLEASLVIRQSSQFDSPDPENV